MNIFKLSGTIVDVVGRATYKGEITINQGKIIAITPREDVDDVLILPGLIDAHVHIESSMLTPAAFAIEAVRSGTVATVSDPHEIANVTGIEGVNFMIENGKSVPFKFFFGAPSCVPATNFETSGARISVDEVEQLLARNDVYFLSEMMNFPGVVYDDPEVMAKLSISRKYNKKVDGHAPLLKDADLTKYVDAGISTDHECFTIEEALEKIKRGMIIQIREGSAAKNFEALYPLIDLYPGKVMLCSDDLHPDDLMKGHLNLLIKRALAKGLDFYNVLGACSVNVSRHYDLPVGALQLNDNADFIVVDSLEQFNVLATYIDGVEVFGKYGSRFQMPETKLINRFEREPIALQQLKVYAPAGCTSINVIEAFDGELFTKMLKMRPLIVGNEIEADVERDLLKIVVVNRYQNNTPPVIGFIKNVGLKQGAYAGSVAHDSHNIIAVGTNDHDLLAAINEVIRHRGGMSVANKGSVDSLELPIAGIMSAASAAIVAKAYERLDNQVKALGSTLRAPFMTLSFMGLLVIPEFKIGDLYLFDGVQFAPAELCNLGE